MAYIVLIGILNTLYITCVGLGRYAVFFEHTQNAFRTRSIRNKYLDVVLCGILCFLGAYILLPQDFSGNI
jgi:hypothetical protein